MEDTTQYLVKLGREIAQEHHNTGESLDSLIVKRASQEKLPEAGRNELIGWTNKGYIDTFSSYEFENATPEGVTSIVYSNPDNNLDVVPYTYPEYNKSGGGKVKAASTSYSPKKTDFSYNIRELVRLDLHELKTKYASMTNQMEDLYGSMSSNIGLLKTLGVSCSAMREQAPHPLVSKLYSSCGKTKSAFVKKENYAIDKYMGSLKSDTQKLTKIASDYKSVCEAIKLRETQLNKVNKLGKIFL